MSHSSNDPLTELLAKARIQKQGLEAIKARQAQQQAEKKPMDDLRNQLARPRGISALSVFRYTLTLLLVAMKLGMFTWMATNPLVATSWFLVLLPAYITEAISLAILLILALGGLVVGSVILAITLIGKVVGRIRRDKTESKQFVEGSKSQQNNDRERSEASVNNLLEAMMKDLGNPKKPPTME